MPTIKLQTLINADRDIVFDLSRNIDIHQISTAQTNEKAVAGRTSGLIELNEWVTWEAMHFGIKQRLTTKITEMQYPNFFVDEMVSGAFKSFKHQHIFKDDNQLTLMIDIFDYTSPLGLLGKVADQLFLFDYMTNLLVTRNVVIKNYAENSR